MQGIRSSFSTNKLFGSKVEGESKSSALEMEARPESTPRESAKTVFSQLKDALSSLFGGSGKSTESTLTKLNLDKLGSSEFNRVADSDGETASISDTESEMSDFTMRDGISSSDDSIRSDARVVSDFPEIGKSLENASTTRMTTALARFEDAKAVLKEINSKLSSPVDIGAPPEEMGKKGDLSGKRSVIEQALTQLRSENKEAFKELVKESNCKLKFFTFKSYEKQLAKHLLESAEAKSLNDGPIKTKEKKFESGDMKLTDLQRPANDSCTITCGDDKSKLSVKLSGDRGETGVGCKTNQQEGSRLGNGNLSQLQVDGKVVCSSVRHAVISSLKVNADTPMLIDSKTQTIKEALAEATDGGRALLEQSFPSDSSEKIDKKMEILNEDNSGVNSLMREVGVLGKDEDSAVKKGLMKKMAQSLANQNKARDAASLHVMKQLEGMSVEDQKAVLSGEKTLDVKMVSISLLTPFGKEGSMLSQQVQAMEDISGLGTLTLNVNGENREINVNIQQSCFNFGVNEGADLARSEEASLNKPSFESFKTMMEDSIRTIKETGTPEQKAELEKNQKCIDALTADLESRMPSFGTASDPFDIPVKLAILADLVGMGPMFNCKSGKDRTGMMDIQMKAARTILENQIKSGGEINLDAISIDKMEEGTPELETFQSTMRTMAQETSSKEIQAENTGVQGYKTNSKASSLEAAGLNMLVKVLDSSSGGYRDTDASNMKKFGLDKPQLFELLYVDSDKTSS